MFQVYDRWNLYAHYLNIKNFIVASFNNKQLNTI